MNILFIGFVKFEKKEDQFCVWFILAQLPTETTRVFFLSHFLNSKRIFFLLLPTSCTCSIPRQKFFVPYLLPSRVKYYLNSQNFPPF